MRIPKNCALALFLAASLIMTVTVASYSPPVSAESDGGGDGGGGDGGDGDGSDGDDGSGDTGEDGTDSADDSSVDGQTVTVTGTPDPSLPSVPDGGGATASFVAEPVTITASRLGQDPAARGLEDLFPYDAKINMLTMRVNDTLTAYTYNARGSGAMLSFLNYWSATYTFVYGNNPNTPIGYEFTGIQGAPFTNVVAVVDPNNQDAWGFMFNVNFSLTTPPNTLTALLNEVAGEQTAPVPDPNPPYVCCDGP